MKNRKSLVFALCAMLGAAGLTACGDDGGNSPQDEQKTGKLIVHPPKMQIESGEEGEIQASYLENKKLNVSTDSKDCVSVVAEEVNTGSTGKTTIKIMALGSGCDANITVSVDDQKEKVAVKVIDNSAPKLTVRPEEVKLAAGDQESAFATYKSASGSVIADATLSLLSSNENCVKVDSSVKTDAEGDAEIVLTAADDAGECTSFITVTPPQGASKNVTVTVSAGSEPEISGTPVLTFTPDKIVEGYEEKAKSGFTVTFKDGSNKGINGQKITFAVDDTTCVKLSNTSKRTGADGTADNSILLLKPGCTANITAKATNAGKDYEAKLPVTINALSEYSIKLALKYENASRFNDVHYTAYKISQDSCDKIFETYKGYEGYIAGINQEDGSEDGITGNQNNQILNTFDIEGIDVEMDKSIVAWGAMDGFGDATAVGCIDVSSANAGQTVVVELEALPLNIIGTYDIIANFDLTSAFPASSASLPPVEDMKAGDWVKFTVDLFKDPVDVLLDFVWANTVSRLKTVSNGNEVVKKIIDFIVNDTTKAIAINALSPMIEDYLNKTENGKRSWFQILTDISGDVEELVRNMQFNGNFKIEEVDANDKTQITKASEEFKNLEYQWNFVPEGGTKNCIQNAYAKKDSCRTSMNLGKVDAIAGSWTGSVSDADGVDGKLKIGSHPLTFKWATILYSAVFGEILPKAMGYSDSKFVSKEGADGYRYITAFLSALVFKPVANFYGQNKAGNKINDNSDDKYPNLTKEGPDNDCQRFIEALVYLIYPGASSASSIVVTVADLACNAGLGQLDTFVEKSLANIESSTENVINLSADGCSLYAEGQLQYQKMGKPDQEFYSAYEVFGPQGKQSMRCDWQISLPDKISKNPIKGLFHGVRSDF